MIHPECISIYWNDIPTCKEQAITYTELVIKWGVTPRKVRSILHDLSCYDNGDDLILIRSGKSKGFYRTNNQAEIEAYKRECLNKGLSVLAPVKKINRVLNLNTDQLNLFDF